jgi:hypothetical protein
MSANAWLRKQSSKCSNFRKDETGREELDSHLRYFFIMS